MKRLKRIARPAMVLFFSTASIMAGGPALAANCQLQGQVRASDSQQPVTIRFVNASGAFRHIDWIDFDGNPEQRASLNPGEVHVQETTAGSPWMISNGPGDCVDIFIPNQSGTINLR